MKEIKFSKPELWTLLNLIEREQDEGCYYGRKDQYYARLKKLHDKLSKEATR